MSSTAQRLLEKLKPAPLTAVGDGFWEVGFRALGSDCELFFGNCEEPLAEQFKLAAFHWLAEFEARCSRFLDDSEISRINANAGLRWTDIHPQTDMLLDLCDHFHFLSQGAFDATSLPLSELWNWKQPHETLPTAAEIADVRSRIGWKRVQRAPRKIFLPDVGMKLDFGGVGKELAVDCLLQIGVGLGLKHVMIDLGGDIAVQGEPPEGGGWYIGLEDPADNDKCYVGLRVRSGGAVATSGDYRRCFQHEGRTYGHILDCRTGWPVANGTRSVTVIAPRCTQAGMLATSAMVLGGSEAIAMLERTPGVQGCLWHQHKLHETRGFRRNVLPAGWDN
jgi:thiamine biosynthesis lipoprotein